MGEFNHWLGTSFSYKFGIDLLTNHTKGKEKSVSSHLTVTSLKDVRNKVFSNNNLPIKYLLCIYVQDEADVSVAGGHQRRHVNTTCSCHSLCFYRLSTFVIIRLYMCSIFSMQARIFSCSSSADTVHLDSLISTDGSLSACGDFFDNSSQNCSVLEYLHPNPYFQHSADYSPFFPESSQCQS